MAVDLSQAPPPPGTIVVRKASTPIVIDGVADEAAWGSATASGDFVTAEGSPEPVGKATADKLVEALAPRVRALKIGPSLDKDSEMGPLVTAEHLAKVKGYVDTGVKEGAKLVVDGRGLNLQGFEKGHFMGGCLFDNVTTDMRIYKEEIFGPVLSVVRTENFGEAAKLPTETGL